MRLNKERFVRPTNDLVNDLDHLLGFGSVQLCGLGTKRMKKKQAQAQQQPLFKDEAAGATPDDADASATELAMAGDAAGDDDLA